MTRYTAQHTVPAFYLRLFASQTGNRNVWQFRKGNAKPISKSPIKAAAETLFYSQISPDGVVDNSTEHTLARLESDAAPAIKKLAQGDALSSEERKIVAHFIAVAFLRVTGLRDHAIADHEKARSVDGAVWFIRTHRHRFPEVSDEALEQFIKEIEHRGYGLDPSLSIYLRDMADRAYSVGKVIRQMNWTIYFAPAGSFFVTSDNPAFVRFPHELFSPGVVGVNREIGGELGFPLSRESFLLASWDSEANWRIATADADRARNLNTRTVLSASSHIYSPEREKWITDLVMEHAGFRLRYPSVFGENDLCRAG